jgi:hypothetical protein
MTLKRSSLLAPLVSTLWNASRCVVWGVRIRCSWRSNMPPPEVIAPDETEILSGLRQPTSVGMPGAIVLFELLCDEYTTKSRIFSRFPLTIWKRFRTNNLDFLVQILLDWDYDGLDLEDAILCRPLSTRRRACQHR